MFGGLLRISGIAVHLSIVLIMRELSDSPARRIIGIVAFFPCVRLA
jgi:hypothetical protein